MSLVRDLNPRADVLQEYRRQYRIDRNGKGYKDVAGSETSYMHGSFLRGNREALYLTLSEIAIRYALKSQGSKAMMNGYRESDSLIVSKKSLNNMRDNKRMAEGMEKRRLAKRNPSKRNRSQAQSWIILPNELERIRYAAQPGMRVNT